MSDPQPQPTALRRTPLHALHRELGARMVPFAGYECRCSIRPASSRSTCHCRTGAALFDVSHMGQARSGATAPRPRSRPGAGRHARAADGRTRYTLLHQRGRRHPRRPDGDAGRRTACSSWSTPPARTPTSPTCAAARPALRVELLSDRALLALQGPKAAAVMARLAPGAAELRFMPRAELDVAGLPCFVSRSGYTGEDGFEISVPAERGRELARAPARRAGGRADRPRRARFPAPGSGPLPLRPRHRRRRPPRSRPGSPGRSASARRAEGGFPGRGRDPARSSPRARRAARRHPPGGPRAGPRRRGASRTRAAGDRQGHQRRLRPDRRRPDRHGLRRDRPRRRPGHALPLEVRGKPLPAARRELPFVAHRYHSADGDHERWPTIYVTPRTTSGCASTATSPRSASPITPRSSSATSSSSSCPRSARTVAKGDAGRGGRIGQGGERGLCAGRRRGDRGQRGARRRSRPRSTATPRATAGSSSSSSPTRASSTADGRGRLQEPSSRAQRLRPRGAGRSTTG